MIIIFLFGSNVSASLTPKVYYYFFKVTKQLFLYFGVSVGYYDFLSVLITMLLFGSFGNITIPYKHFGFYICNFVSSSSGFSCAVNYICGYCKCVCGFNTDAFGFMRGLFTYYYIFKRCRLLILGAGGAFNNIMFGVAGLCGRFLLYNRTMSRYRGLVLASIDFNFYIFGGLVDCIINTVPLIYFKRFLLLNPVLISANVYVYDITYGVCNSLCVFFGCYIYGFSMLYMQAIENFKLYGSRCFRFS